AKVNGLSDALDFSWTIGAERLAPFEHGGRRGTVGEVSSYMRYDAPLFDEALAPPLFLGYGYYNTSAHFLWTGDCTRRLEGAHVEYFRRSCNLIGIKVGPSMVDSDLAERLDGEGGPPISHHWTRTRA
ncbi:hypothetical protein EDD85DRAFT_773142, partial [Armillaria nabsnona]